MCLWGPPSEPSHSDIARCSECVIGHDLIPHGNGPGWPGPLGLAAPRWFSASAPSGDPSRLHAAWGLVRNLPLGSPESGQASCLKCFLCGECGGMAPHWHCAGLGHSGNLEEWHPIGTAQRLSVQCGERTRLAREAWRTLCWCSWWVFPGPIAFLHSLSVLVNTAALSLRFIYLFRKLYRKTHTRFPVCWFTPQIPVSAGVE